MKKTIFILKTTLLITIIQGCSGVLGGNPPPTCEWNENNHIVFYGLGLKHPAELSNYHIGLLPIDKTERSLVGLLQTTGNGPPSSAKAKISVNIYSTGTGCVGEWSDTFMRGNPLVFPNSISVRFVSNAVFEGEVTVGIRTDTYNNTVGNGSYYHIMWSATGNEPNGSFIGDILGKKISYAFPDGTSSRVYPRQGYIIINGRKNYM